MRLIPTLVVLAFTLMTSTAPLHAAYQEVMDPNGLTRNLGEDYDLVDDNAAINQTGKIQKAIDDVSAAGGGRIIIPKGTYKFASVLFKSDVHLLVEAGTVIKPDWPEGKKAVVFRMDAERPERKKNVTPTQEQAFIENVSIRGIGGPWIIDYSDRERKPGEGIRGVLTRMVRNFLIADLDIRDNYTTYCGITLTPTSSSVPFNVARKWEVSRSTNGTIRNCRIFHSSPGYGLTQLHGAQSVHFENIYADGGVTLRLETGAVGNHTAVFDVTARNVTSENGRCAVMLGPHSAMNGRVQVDGVRAISSAYAVTIGRGNVKKKEAARNPEATPGRFADGSIVRNIHAVFGKTAQAKTHVIQAIPEEYYRDMELVWENKFFRAPSIGAVRDSSGTSFDVKIENVTMEGFKHNADKPILTPDDVRPGKWPDELRKWKAGINQRTSPTP